jgi:proline iminopeptidase
MRYLEPELQPLAARHVLLLYDQRGSGRSTLVTDSALDARHFADDLEAIRAHFHLQRLTLFAHSWGAGVAALYAKQHPERIGRLLIVDGISVRRTHHPVGLQTLESRLDSAGRAQLQQLRTLRISKPGDVTLCRQFFELWFRPMLAEATASRRTAGDFCGDSSAALANKIQSVDRFTLPSLGNWDWRAALAAVHAPVLVIRGTLDHVPLESAREWTAASPDGRLLQLEGAGHFPYLDLPERFFSAVETFLAGRWPEGSSRVTAETPR